MSKTQFGQKKTKTTFIDVESHESSPEAAQAVIVKSQGDQVPPPPMGSIEPSRRDYGIENAIGLMRRLPESDLKLVATVIKESLESANIKISNILKDAEQKEARLEEQVKKLDCEIENLEAMIHQRKDAIFELIRDLEETRRVKNNLALAEGSHSIELPSDDEELSLSDFQDKNKELVDEETSKALLETLFGQNEITDPSVSETLKKSST